MPTSEHTTSVEFRTIERHPGYRFGDDGSVWSCWKTVSLGTGGGTKQVIGDQWWQMGGCRQKSGYIAVYMRDKKIHRVHTLILEAFRGPRPPGMWCRHLDGNPSNNRIENLCWGTQKENHEDSVRHGTHIDPPRGDDGPTAKLTTVKVRDIRDRHRHGQSQASLAREFGVTEGTMWNVIHRRSWKDVS